DGLVSQPMGFLVPLVRGTVAGRSVLERQAVGVTDLQGETEEYPEGSALARQTGQRATLSVPLLREGAPIGVILLRRAEAVPFTDKQIALVEAFATQAVIAIENVRLFNETKEALERQTATSEILGVIAGSPTEIQPVLDAIAENAARVCGANDAVIYRIEQGDVTRLVAGYGPIPKRRVGEQGRNLIRESIPGRAMRDRQTVHVHSIQSAEGEAVPSSGGP